MAAKTSGVLRQGMDFADSAICSPDVGRSIGNISNAFVPALRTHLSNVHAATGLKTIVFFPTVLDPSVGRMDDKTTYKRSEPAVYLKVNIDHGAWRSAHRVDQLHLYADALRRGIATVRTRSLSDEDRKGVTLAINASVDEIERQWRAA